MKRILYVIYIGLTVIGCRQEQQDKKSVTDHISGESLSCKALVGSAFVCLHDNMVIMKSFSKDSVAVIYQERADSLHYVKHIGIRGRGPYEFIDAIFSYDSDSLYILNESSSGNMLHLRAMGMADMGQIDNYKLWKEYKLDWMEGFMSGDSFVPLDGQKFLFLGDKWGEQNLISLVDLKNNELVPLNYWIEDDYDGPVIPKQSIYMINSSIIRNGNKILFACGEGRYLEILELHNGEITGRTPIYTITPKYEPDKDGLNYKIKYDNYRGMQVCTTDKYIYAFLRVWTPERKPYKGYPWYCFDEVEVYDWNGNFIKNYQTDIPFYDMIVSNDDKTLYTLTQDNDTKEAVIHKYTLNNNLNQ